MSITQGKRIYHAKAEEQFIDQRVSSDVAGVNKCNGCMLHSMYMRICDGGWGAGVCLRLLLDLRPNAAASRRGALIGE